MAFGLKVVFLPAFKSIFFLKRACQNLDLLPCRMCQNGPLLVHFQPLIYDNRGLTTILREYLSIEGGNY